MANDNHSFSIEDAKKHGVEKALIVNHFRFFLKCHQSNGTHQYDGYTWAYNTAKSLNELMPYLNVKSIQRWLVELEQDGVLISGNYNKLGIDKTKWYTMPEFAITQKVMPITQNEESNTQNEQAIPIHTSIQSTTTKKYTLTQSKDGELFETLNNQKEKAPPVSAAPPEYFELPLNISNHQEKYNSWVSRRGLTHGRLGLFEQENQIMLFVGYCNRNNLDQYQFFEHCVISASAGGWKNLNPELANKSFTVKAIAQSGQPKSKVAQNVENILDYARRNP